MSCKSFGPGSDSGKLFPRRESGNHYFALTLDDCLHDTLRGKVRLKIRRTGIRLRADRRVSVVLHLINGNKLRLYVRLTNRTAFQVL